jgi:hypothetical protein
MLNKIRMMDKILEISSEVFTAIIFQMVVWAVTPYSLVGIFRHFMEICGLHLPD